MDKKFVMSEKALNTIKEKVAEATKLWNSLSVKEKNAIIVSYLETTKTVEPKGRPFYGTIPVPFAFIEEDDKGNKAPKAGPMTLSMVLKMGPKAWDANGNGIVVYGKNGWKLPYDYSDENAAARMAAECLYKGFNPAKTPIEAYVAYTAPISDLAMRERECRNMREEALEEGKAVEANEWLEKANALKEEREKENCMGLAKFLKYSERFGNVAPFTHDGSEEGKITACMKLRIKDFNKWFNDHKKEAEALADARIDGWTPNWETDVERYNRILSSDANSRWSKEKEDKEAVVKAMKGDEPFFETFAEQVNAMFSRRGWGREVLFLDETNAEGALHKGWGKLVRATLLPDGKEAANRVRFNKKEWSDYLLTKKGEPMSLYGFIALTYYLVGEGMSPEAYCSAVGIPQRQLKEYLSWKRWKAAKAAEVAEVANTFIGNISAWTVKETLPDEAEAM